MVFVVCPVAVFVLHLTPSPRPLDNPRESWWNIRPRRQQEVRLIAIHGRRSASLGGGAIVTLGEGDVPSCAM